jgi:hypothetical protein
MSPGSVSNNLFLKSLVSFVTVSSTIFYIVNFIIFVQKYNKDYPLGFPITKTITSYSYYTYSYSQSVVNTYEDDFLAREYVLAALWVCVYLPLCLCSIWMKTRQCGQMILVLINLIAAGCSVHFLVDPKKCTEFLIKYSYKEEYRENMTSELFWKTGINIKTLHIIKLTSYSFIALVLFYLWLRAPKSAKTKDPEKMVDPYDKVAERLNYQGRVQYVNYNQPFQYGAPTLSYAQR